MLGTLTTACWVALPVEYQQKDQEAAKHFKSIIAFLLGADILADADFLWCPSTPASL